MPTTVVGSNPVRVVNAGDGPGVLVNRDLVNSILIGPSISIYENNVSVASILDALVGVPFDGSQDVYAATVSTSAAPVTVDFILGAQNWNPSPAQSAQQIAALGLATSANQLTNTAAVNAPTYGPFTHVDGVDTGVPATHGFTADADQATVTVAASGGVQTAFFSIARPGYVVDISTAQATLGNNPIMQVDMSWQILASGHEVAHERWWVPVSVAGAVIQGKGPTKANSLVIVFTNHDSQAMNVTYSFCETTQHVARDDWRGTTAVPYGTFIAPPSSDPLALVAASFSVLIAAAGTKTYALPLYCGQAYLSVLQSAATASEFQIEPFDPDLSTAFLMQFSTSVAAPNAPPTVQVTFPRSPCGLTIINNGAGNNTYTVTVTYQEYAS